MDPDLIDALKGLAARHIWWKTPDEAIAAPRRVIARVMDIGDYGDVQRLARLVGDDALSEALTEAEPGWFSPRSWVYSILGLLAPSALSGRSRRRPAGAVAIIRINGLFLAACEPPPP